MNNSDMPAMPQPMVSADDGEIYSTLDNYGSDHAGLTKREHFAGLAMQGLLANPGGVVQANATSGTNWCNCDASDMAQWAISCADALLKELEK